MKNLREWIGMITIDIFRAVVDRTNGPMSLSISIEDRHFQNNKKKKVELYNISYEF